MPLSIYKVKFFKKYVQKLADNKIIMKYTLIKIVKGYKHEHSISKDK